MPPRRVEVRTPHDVGKGGRKPPVYVRYVPRVDPARERDVRSVGNSLRRRDVEPVTFDDMAKLCLHYRYAIPEQCVQSRANRCLHDACEEMLKLTDRLRDSNDREDRRIRAENRYLRTAVAEYDKVFGAGGQKQTPQELLTRLRGLEKQNASLRQQTSRRDTQAGDREADMQKQLDTAMCLARKQINEARSGLNSGAQKAAPVAKGSDEPFERYDPIRTMQAPLLMEHTVSAVSYTKDEAQRCGYANNARRRLTPASSPCSSPSASPASSPRSQASYARRPSSNAAEQQRRQPPPRRAAPTAGARLAQANPRSKLLEATSLRPSARVGRNSFPSAARAAIPVRPSREAVAALRAEAEIRRSEAAFEEFAQRMM
ncbi:hypothetical protein DIPPA_08175 [Diplonema papillatum]|nr:hypothetical protein DIPPA_08175 [Diplonema papillatum]